MIMIMPNFLTAETAAVRLGISKTLLYKWCRQGRISPAFKFKNETLFRTDEINSLVLARAADIQED